MNVKERDFHFKRFGGGIVLFMYQIAFGVSLRLWEEPPSLAFRIYIGPIKLWGYIKLK